jgi:cyclin B
MNNNNASIPTTHISLAAALDVHASQLTAKIKPAATTVALRRDPLMNITNQNVLSKKTGVETKSGKVVIAKGSMMNSKRPAGLGENEPKVLKHKKRKSDPMIIDEEDQKSTPVMVKPTFENIDHIDCDDPQAVVEYVNDIYQYLMIKEKDRVDFRYLSLQPDINEKMRAILVDWLVEVHRMFKLLPETLFLSISIIDRYLSIKQVARNQLQLIGISSMLIASKFEEIYAPECNDFVYISDGAYTKPQILQTEQTILNTLNFNITHPSALHFLRRYSKAASSDYTLHTICKYLIELVLIDVKFLRFNTSLVSAAAVYLSRAMTGKYPLWTGTLHHYSTYPEEVVRECAIEMNEFLKKSHQSSLKAIRKKYSLPKYGQVAEIPLVDL